VVRSVSSKLIQNSEMILSGSVASVLTKYPDDGSGKRDRFRREKRQCHGSFRHLHRFPSKTPPKLLPAIHWSTSTPPSRYSLPFKNYASLRVVFSGFLIVGAVSGAAQSYPTTERSALCGDGVRAASLAGSLQFSNSFQLDQNLFHLKY
jgi:hypothetical protein